MWDADIPPDQDLRNTRNTKKILTRTVIILLVCYMSVPWFFRYSSLVKSDLAFLNLIQNPFRMTFVNPAAKYGLVGARNFYLTTPDGEVLGVWHLLPKELQDEGALVSANDHDDAAVASRYQEWLQRATVFVYCHGAAGSRASKGRVKFYKVLNSLGYHVITFDYRGFGDSTGHPTTERDVAVDARTVLEWLRERVGGGHIFYWGHSLGSGVVSHLLANLESEPDNPVVGAVLESPFTNLLDALRAYPPALPYASLPGFDFFAVEPIAQQGLTFYNEEYLKNVSVPLLFLHAKDDLIVPYRLGIKLYETVVRSRKDNSTVTFVGFSEKLGYGHSKIGTDPHLGVFVKDFVENSVKRKILKLKK